MDKIAIRHDIKLTGIAIKIFGDIVDKAFVTTNTYLLCDTDTDNAETRLTEKSKGIDSDEASIDVDGDMIWIRFKNGKVVSFSASEWGDIFIAKTEESYEA